MLDDEEDRAYRKATLLEDREKAQKVQFTTTGKTCWIPKSVSEWHRNGIIMIAQWYADKEDL